MRLYFKSNLLTATNKLGYRHISNNSDGFKWTKQPVVDVKYYKILGLNLDETITDEILQKAVSKKLHQVHPDKGGSNKDTMDVLAARKEFRKYLLNSNYSFYSSNRSNSSNSSNRSNSSNSSNSSKQSNGSNRFRFNNSNSYTSADIPWSTSFLMTIMCFSPVIAFGALADFTHKKEYERRDRDNNRASFQTRAYGL